MIVDTSAIMAMIIGEPEREPFARLLARTDRVALSAATYVEASIVIDSRRSPVMSRQLDTLMGDFQLIVEPVTLEHAKVAREAYRDFGRGSGHPARLNFGDCFSYALARVTGEPLLFKGDDFVHTDLTSALPPS